MWDPYIQYRQFYRFKSDEELDFHSWMKCQFSRYVTYRNMSIPEISDSKEKEKYILDLKTKWLGDFHHWLKGPSANKPLK